MARQSERSVVEGMALQMFQRFKAELDEFNSRELALLRPELRDKISRLNAALGRNTGA